MDNEKFVSKRASSIELSPIRKFFNMVSKVPGALSLTIGQPDFETPGNIKRAGIEAISSNMTSYSHNQGYIELRQEISNYLKKGIGIDYDYESEITVTVGSGQAIDAAIRTLVDDSDEVLIPSPGYVAYGACVTLCGGIPVYVPVLPEDNFKLKTEILKRYVTPRTKMLILSYPCNPTGATMGEVDLLEISKLVCEKDLMVISDEVYSEMTYGKKHTSIASIEHMKDRTIVINGFSKAYSMTGWRLGYAAAPREIMKHIVKVHQYNVTCAPTISQAAGIEALRNGGNSVSEMVAEYNNRRLYCIDRIKKIGLPCFEPTGAFYIFPQIKEFGMPSEEFCLRLLQQERLAIVPGYAFGSFGEGFVRISYAYSQSVLEDGFDRLEKFIASLRNNTGI